MPEVKDKTQPRRIDMQRSFSALNPSGDLESPGDDLSEVETVCSIGTVQRMWFAAIFDVELDHQPSEHAA